MLANELDICPWSNKGKSKKFSNEAEKNLGSRVRQIVKKNSPENLKVSGESYDLQDNGNMHEISRKNHPSQKFTIKCMKITLKRPKRPFYWQNWLFRDVLKQIFTVIIIKSAQICKIAKKNQKKFFFSKNFFSNFFQNFWKNSKKIFFQFFFDFLKLLHILPWFLKKFA